MDSARLIFAKSFLLTRHWELLFNRQYADAGLTLKQMMLLLVLSNAFQEDPTIKEVSQVLMTSHQNVKAMAIQLEGKSFIKLYTDENDKRITRLKVDTEKMEFWRARQQEDDKVFNMLFQGISQEDLEFTANVIERLLSNAILSEEL
ncbi:MAG: hypothetical protein JXR88_05120 [Clostridia bacterium]|nr:hypothetical protein [Clostridia bacterium]